MEINLNSIQQIIGYNFNNLDLLKQAFIRRSYATENGGLDNQVLELIGDKVLDIAIVRVLTITYGSITQTNGINGYNLDHKEYFKYKFKEGDFSIIRQELVEGKFLANCIKNLGLHNYLKFGKSEANNINNNDDASEDLFEAILGAVALDCDWDIPTITLVVDVMLDINSYLFKKDTDEDKYLLILQEWALNNKFGLPIYKYDYKGNLVFECKITFFKNEKFNFVGIGSSEAESRRKAAKNAYFELLNQGLIVNQYRKTVGDPNIDKSLEQINILVSKKMIDIPTFKYDSQYDKNGNETWNCSITNTNCDKMFSTYCHNSKVEAKKACAYEYLRYIMDEFDYEG